MKNGSFKHNRRMAGLAGILGLACSPLAAFGTPGDLLSLQTFSSNTTGWTSAGSAATWTSGNGYLSCGSGGTGTAWRSPTFTVTPNQYYKVEYSVKGAGYGQIGDFGVNPVTQTYDMENTWSQSGNPAGGFLYYGVPGQSLWDNYSTTPATGSGWTNVVRYVRAQPNATSAFIRFDSQVGQSLPNGLTGSTINIDNVQVSSATAADAAAWADTQYAQLQSKASIRANPITNTATRWAHMTNTMGKLAAGQTVSIAMLGDSIINNAENSAFDTLVQRMYPGSQVNLLNATGHGTGMAMWDHPDQSQWQQAPLKLQEAVINQHPDLVILGGISNGFGGSTTSDAYLSTVDVISRIRAGSPNTEILLMTGAEGTPLPVSGSFQRSVSNLSATDDRRMLSALAATDNTAFFDMYGEWGQYYLDLTGNGQNYDLLRRDVTHANDLGRQMQARALEQFFQPVPEPTSLSLLGLGAMALLGRRRKA